jgi:hypothetical protein
MYRQYLVQVSAIDTGNISRFTRDKNRSMKKAWEMIDFQTKENVRDHYLDVTWTVLRSLAWLPDETAAPPIRGSFEEKRQRIS